MCAYQNNQKTLTKEKHSFEMFKSIVTKSVYKALLTDLVYS